MIRILVDKCTAKYLVNTKKGFGFISEKQIGDKIEMIFKTAEIDEGFPRWYLSFADCATILEPEELKINVKKLFNKIQGKL